MPTGRSRRPGSVAGWRHAVAEWSWRTTPSHVAAAWSDLGCPRPRLGSSRFLATHRARVSPGCRPVDAVRGRRVPYAAVALCACVCACVCVCVWANRGRDPQWARLNSSTSTSTRCSASQPEAQLQSDNRHHQHHSSNTTLGLGLPTSFDLSVRATDRRRWYAGTWRRRGREGRGRTGARAAGARGLEEGADACTRVDAEMEARWTT